MHGNVVNFVVVKSASVVRMESESEIGRAVGNLKVPRTIILNEHAKQSQGPVVSLCSFNRHASVGALRSVRREITTSRL